MRNVFATFIGIILAFLILEVIVRIFSPQMTGPVEFAYEPKIGAIPVPNQSGFRSLPGFYRFEYHNGLYGNRLTGGSSTGSEKILFLGDSFTYGIGVNDNETFAALVGKKMPAAVINAGDPGSGPDYALRFLQFYGKEIDPKMIVLSFFSADFPRNIRFEISPDGRLVPKELPSHLGRWKNFLLHSKLYNAAISYSQFANLIKKLIIDRVLSHRPTSAGSLVMHHETMNGIYSNAENTLMTRRILNAMQLEAKLLKSDLVIFYIPSMEEVEAYRRDGAISGDEKSFRKIVPNDSFASLTPVIANLPDPIENLYYQNPLDRHWTPKAHAGAAEFIANYLKRMTRSATIRLPKVVTPP